MITRFHSFDGTRVCSDTGRNGFLVSADIIAHVKIMDTVSTFDSTAHVAKHMVLVTAEIQAPIKGKFVPKCANNELNTQPHQISQSVSTFPQLADSGVCLQFNYALEWDRFPNTDIRPLWPFGDASGTWVKPNKEYIIFLRLQGTRGNIDNNTYFTVIPMWGVFGTAGGMYPITDGLVVDPADDFGIGADTGLTPSQWKAGLLTRINELINP